ncbi:MAG: RIP metalloprotease RseP [Candidatus Aminicenantes bacterium]|nr:RIP metalloprotease RseP [Candidatus Aminicenantes bacterium]
MTILGNIFWFLVLFTIIVIVHEFGHFATAKFLKIGVETFSIGFGPRLIGFKKRETDYRISLVPLGGYVKLMGEEEPTGDPRDFLSRPKWQKLLVLIMGPVMNVILAVAVMTGVYMGGLQEPAFYSQPVKVGWVEPGSPADKAGIKKGDLIIELAGKKNPTWRDLRIIVSTNAGQKVKVGIKRGNKVLETSLIPERVGRYSLGYSGIYVPTEAVVGIILPGSPAERAGLKEGDRILEVDGKKVEDFYSLRDLINATQGRETIIKIKRNGRVLELKIKPKKMQGRWMLGFTPFQPSVKKKFNFFKALSYSAKENLYYTTLTFEVLGKLIAGKLSPKTLSGPIDIAQFSYATASAGLIPFLSFLAFVSLQLAIINLVPIPGLDGGQILILLIEAIIGRELSERAKDWILKIGFSLIILLSIFVLFNDILKRL